MKIGMGWGKTVVALQVEEQFPHPDGHHSVASRQYSYSALPRSAASLTQMVVRSAVHVTSVVGIVVEVQTSTPVIWVQLYQLVGLAVCDRH